MLKSNNPNEMGISLLYTSRQHNFWEFLKFVGHYLDVNLGLITTTLLHIWCVLYKQLGPGWGCLLNSTGEVIRR